MPREVPRARRIAEQVQRTLSQLLLREVRDPRLKPMTVTHVKVSPDLTHVWVKYTLLAGDSHDEQQREILEEAASYLRGPLARSLRLRLAPELHFAPDEELEAGNRLDELITRAVQQDRAKGSVPTDPPPTSLPDDEAAHYDSNDDDDEVDDRP
ncbi:MAG TPA: 30S ribosome-binding factor RbfA [Steroidobacteraceae bacterium]|nr:30S ribosome-binding factor RbfA [Steroidobacteraceae bacterium]